MISGICHIIVTGKRRQRVRVYCWPVLTFPVEGGKWSVSCPGHFTCRERGPSVY